MVLACFSCICCFERELAQLKTPLSVILVGDDQTAYLVTENGLCLKLLQ
jgi:hypothetical protein